ncbi:TPA: hypothetical protein ACGW3M_001024 [Pseudomonas aeruginosa]|uniref:hypothetical protein n=1 Tax=Pseudomonas aeruginosa TaxID=287 RepID=UPI0027E98D7B|nr:hypothetical protein [Pseudomonas aeruginosa]EKY4113635.1 hypothetical protein [Pseudomonas aeruginosa]ELJ2276157.1 hypothetical protein [Pseudomonas aeruginosa]MCS8414845.1 hypothetical protein [Pseudomonas aeruginosa]MCS9764352.1 hypothetical protein [Pseudomonas aeruginosa]
MTNASQAPDAGAIFDLNGQQYRVTGWLAEVPASASKPAAWMAEILEGLSGTQDMAPRYRWCHREEATHVAGYGVAGCVVPVTSIKVTGTVDWSAEQLQEARAIAEQLAQQGELIV